MVKTNLILTLLILASSIVSAQLTEIKLTPSDSTEGTLFGRSVALSGDYAFVGAPRATTIHDTLVGAVYVFKKEGGIWSESQRLIPSDGTMFDFFGGKISIHGDYAAITANSKVDSMGQRGYIYIFKFENGTWSEQTKIRGSGIPQYNSFGQSISLHENHLIVGSSFGLTPTNEVGIAHLFERDGDTWTETKTFVPADVEQPDLFGSAVAMYDNVILVSAPNNSEVLGDVVGAVYVFRYSNGIWKEEIKLLPSYLVAGLSYGSSLAIYKDIALIGANEINSGRWSPGSAYFNHYQDANWTEVIRVRESDPLDNALFGRSVSIHGDYALIGASSDTVGGFFSGSASLFRYDKGTWKQEFQLSSNNPSSTRSFGFDVAIEQDHALVGTTIDGDYGAAYMYSGFFRDVLVDIELDSAYQFIPMTGDTFPINLAFSNETQEIQNLQYWTEVIRTADGHTDTLFAPVDLELQSAATAGAQYTMEMPGSVAPGRYKVTAYTGSYPENIIDSDSVIVVKLDRLPFVSNPIADQTVIRDFRTYVVADLDSVFAHPDNRALTYFASTDGNTIASVTDSLLELSRVRLFVGTSQVIVTAVDDQPAFVSDTFQVFVEPRTGIRNTPAATPQNSALFQNSPNPFNPQTTISYQLAKGGHVNIKIYSLIGQQVKTLVNETQAAGAYLLVWDGSNDSGQAVASGIYIYKLEAGSFAESRKMMLLR